MNIFNFYPTKNWYRPVLLIFFSILIISCNSDDSEGEPNQVPKTEFLLQKGTNVSHWLSQNKARGVERKEFFTEQDVENIAALGFDHIRIPLDEEQLWKADGIKDSEAFGLLKDALGWAEKNDLKVIIDIHVLRSTQINGALSLWTDPENQENFVNLWRDISEELDDFPVTDLAYELLNEPVAVDADDWNKLVKRTLNVIRNNEPTRIVIVGSNGAQSPEAFDKLKVPSGDKNIMLGFHYYSPLLLTHHKAPWTEFGNYEGPVHYPGQVIEDEELAALPQNVATRLKIYGAQQIYNEAKIKQDLMESITVARQLGLQLYCGEWGALVTAPREDRLRWYRDVRKVFEENGIAWANWDYKSTGFGFTNGAGINHDLELIKVLNGN